MNVSLSFSVLGTSFLHGVRSSRFIDASFHPSIQLDLAMFTHLLQQELQVRLRLLFTRELRFHALTRQGIRQNILHVRRQTTAQRVNGGGRYAKGGFQERPRGILTMRPFWISTDGLGGNHALHARRSGSPRTQHDVNGRVIIIIIIIRWKRDIAQGVRDDGTNAFQTIVGNTRSAHGQLLVHLIVSLCGQVRRRCTHLVGIRQTGRNAKCGLASVVGKRPMKNQKAVVVR